MATARPAMNRSGLDEARHGIEMLILGMSHAGAPRAWVRHNPDPDVAAEVLPPGIEPSGVADWMTDRVTAMRPRVLVSMVYGNHHNSLGLLEAPEPFDFEDPGLPGLMPGRRPLPRMVVRAALEDPMTGVLLLLRHLRRLTDGPLFHVAAPPPVGDEAHLTAHPGRFAELAGGTPVFAPRRVRMKLYRLQNEILAGWCRAEGITMIEPPAVALCPEGFLAKGYRTPDPTHANHHYGREILAALKASPSWRPAPARGASREGETPIRRAAG